MIDDDLLGHTPSAAARRRAAAAGIELEEVRSLDPDTYRMLNAVTVVNADSTLFPMVEPALARTLPRLKLFSAAHGGWVSVLAFPEPTKDELALMDDALASVAARFESEHAYFRRVEDQYGERREIAVPQQPSQWNGAHTMVGPFEDEAQARAWASDNVMGVGSLTYDTLPLHGYWFCDVFPGDV